MIKKAIWPLLACMLVLYLYSTQKDKSVEQKPEIQPPENSPVRPTPTQTTTDIQKDEGNSVQHSSPSAALPDTSISAKKVGLILTREQSWFAVLKANSGETNAQATIDLQKMYFPYYFVTLNQMKEKDHVYVWVEQSPDLEAAMNSSEPMILYFQKGRSFDSKSLENIDKDDNYCSVEIDGYGASYEKSSQLFLRNSAVTQKPSKKVIQVTITNSVSSSQKLRQIKSISCYKIIRDEQKKEFDFIELLYHLNVDGTYISSK